VFSRSLPLRSCGHLRNMATATAALRTRQLFRNSSVKATDRAQPLTVATSTDLSGAFYILKYYKRQVSGLGRCSTQHGQPGSSNDLGWRPAFLLPRHQVIRAVQSLPSLKKRRHLRVRQPGSAIGRRPGNRTGTRRPAHQPRIGREGSICGRAGTSETWPQRPRHCEHRNCSGTRR
jgi:hypothetical protein